MIYSPAKDPTSAYHHIGGYISTYEFLGTHKHSDPSTFPTTAALTWYLSYFPALHVGSGCARKFSSWLGQAENSVPSVPLPVVQPSAFHVSLKVLWLDKEMERCRIARQFQFALSLLCCWSLDALGKPTMAGTTQRQLLRRPFFLGHFGKLQPAHHTHPSSLPGPPIYSHQTI